MKERVAREMDRTTITLKKRHTKNVHRKLSAKNIAETPARYLQKTSISIFRSGSMHDVPGADDKEDDHRYFALATDCSPALSTTSAQERLRDDGRYSDYPWNQQLG